MRKPVRISCHIIKLATNFQFDWLIRGPPEAILGHKKSYCTSNSITNKSQCVLKDKFATSVGQESLGNYSIKNH